MELIINGEVEKTFEPPKVGDIIQILSDQNGHPKFEVDPKTRKCTSRLKKFRVKEITESGYTLEPFG